MKIISLVPSITETLFDLGLTKDEIIGRTKFCIHPENQVNNVAVIGGTKSINIEKIRSLNPDIIIANKEENTKEDVEELSLTCFRHAHYMLQSKNLFVEEVKQSGQV